MEFLLIEVLFKMELIHSLLKQWFIVLRKQEK